MESFIKQQQRRSRVLLLAAVLLLDLEDEIFRELLDSEGRQRHDRRIPRVALLTPRGYCI
jgi:hypothetical protein